jgi:ABC-type branched-subunit amino acid transport system ATPase component
VVAPSPAVKAAAETLLDVRNLTISYGEKVALKDVTLDVRRNEIFGIIGPANAGKTSFLRSLNRMDEFVHTMKVQGDISFAGRDLTTVRNLYALRRMIGVVFPLPVGLPLSIYNNVALAPRLAGNNKKADLDVIVERCLRRAALWDEVKDRLNSLGSLLSGGQQQRLTIARALSQEPQLHHPGHQPGAASAPPRRSHGLLPRWHMRRNRQDRTHVHWRRNRPTHRGLLGGTLWIIPQVVTKQLRRTASSH